MSSLTRAEWDQTWISIARVMARRSLCVRDQVGAVVVSEWNRVLATGYNGPPAGYRRQGVTVTGDCSNWCPRSRQALAETRLGRKANLDPTYEDCHALHAEQNALMVGERTPRERGTIYVSSPVCGICAKLIANSGLSRLVFDPRSNVAYRRSADWLIFLESCGIRCEEFPGD